MKPRTKYEERPYLAKPQKRARKTPKQVLWDWVSKYVRLSACVNYSSGKGRCVTCNKPVHWKSGHAGHFIGRGIGGSSGVYFDRRNIHFQCPECNNMPGGNYEEYKKFMLKEYGQEVIDELKAKGKEILNIDYDKEIPRYKKAVQALKERL
jgi:hypothetical protein